VFDCKYVPHIYSHVATGGEVGDRGFADRKLTRRQCNEPYAENDVIPILPIVPTDIARLNLRVKTLREKRLTHALKKAPGSKKDKKRKHADTSTSTDATTTSSNGATKPSSSDEDKTTTKSEKKAKKDTPASFGLKNSATASLTKKVLEEQEERNKRRKMAQNENMAGLFNKKEHKPSKGNSADFMTRGFSIARK
jgi:hypothetical protein